MQRPRHSLSRRQHESGMRSNVLLARCVYVQKVGTAYWHAFVVYSGYMSIYLYMLASPDSSWCCT